MPDNDDMLAIDNELAELEQRLLAEDEDEPADPVDTPADPPADTTVTTDTTTATNVPGDDDEGLHQSAIAVIARLPRDRQNALLSQLGFDTTPKEVKQIEEQNLVKGAQKQTTESMLTAARAMVPAEMLPADIEDYSPEEQNMVYLYLASKVEGQNIASKEIAPLMEQKAQQEHVAKLSATSQGWATELGKPEAAENIYNFISQFPPEYVAMYENEVKNGGGPLAFMVSEQVKKIVNDMNVVDEAKTAKPIPKSEDVTVATNDGPELKGDALDIYNDLAASGKMSEDELRKTRKELARVK